MIENFSLNELKVFFLSSFTDCSSPFMVGVHFDDQVDTASDMAANRGTFCNLC